MYGDLEFGDEGQVEREEAAMWTQRTPFLNWNLLLVVGPIPALAGLITVIVVESIPILTILAIVVIAYAILLAGITEASKAERAQPTAVGARPELELMNTVPLAVAPATIGVIRTSGTCPLGFRPGYTWTLEQGGHLSHQLCRPAVDALTPVLQRSMHDELEHEVSCQCPLAERDVVFGVRVGE